MRRVLFWLVLLLALLVLALVATDPHGAVAELVTRRQAALVLRVGVLVLIAGAAIALLRANFPRALGALLAWAVIGLALFVGYTYRFELREAADRALAELVPGRAAVRGRTVELARDNAGDFGIMTEVNGRRVPMVLDTGASTVVLTSEAARAAGLPLEMIKYTVSIDTANGRGRAAPVTLDRVSIGGIVERAVPALVAQPGQLRTNLLGMSFLNRLQSWEVRGDRLVMRGYP